MSDVTGAWTAAAAVLREYGVTTVFGLPGDDMEALAAVTDAEIKFVLCRDQRNAVFMATGYALQSGRLGVAVIGKGPAVTNAATGLLEASSSAAPVLVLSAGTATERRGSGAFQELDQVAAVQGLVKWAARVEHPDRFQAALRRAALVAQTGAPGPVYLELPDHLLTVPIPLDEDRATRFETTQSVNVSDVSSALKVVRAARRPILLVGGGMRHANQSGLLEQFAAELGAAVACTASGRGAVDEASPLFCGLSGLYTPEPAARLWAETDCVVALGSRLEETATYQWPDRIGREVPVVQVNVDAGHFSFDFGGPKVLGEVQSVLRAWRLQMERRESRNTEWVEAVREVHEGLRSAAEDTLRELASVPQIHIAEVLHTLQQVVPGDRVLVQENGLQDMWSYRFPLYACTSEAGSVVPSEQTSLGFGAAAAVGVKQAAPERPVVAFVGDGAFNLFDADLPTAIEQGHGLLYVVLDNGGYGWLQSQLDQRERPVPGHSFIDPAAVSSRIPQLPGLRHLTLSGKATLLSDVTQAWKWCAAGDVVVLTVLARMDDALFADAAAGGDFPVLERPEAAGGTEQ
ncbi:thiamine pyrophosphate-binding protein [Streptomyces buecherae]|uniref:thiamine pyrophosphate-binding protein n=1 Tax=Streptomyces buecherae TaxID=2763006 RepID=UPI0034090FF0